MIKFINYCTISGSTAFEFPYGMDEQHPNCIALKLTLTERIAQLHNHGISDFFCNAEYGLPLWAAEIIVGMRSFGDNPPRIHIVTPHENQAILWSDEVRERYYNLHIAASTVIMLNTQYNDACYREADEFMLNHSIALLTDNGNNTATTYAKRKNKHIELIRMPIFK